MSSPNRSAGFSPKPRHQSVGLCRTGAALSLLGGIGTLGALFLPWLSLTLVSEQICSDETCISTPDRASIQGWEIFISHAFLFFAPLLLIVLSALINLTSGALRLRTPQAPQAPWWHPFWFWGALVVTSGALTAFFPWLITFPFPGASSLVDGHVVTYQFAPGFYLAIGAVLASLVGMLLPQEWFPKSSVRSSVASMDQQARRATWDRRLSGWLALVSLMLLLVFSGFFIASTAAFIPRMSDDAFHGWEVVFFLLLPPVVGGLTLASLLHAFRRHQRVWLALLCLSLTHISLGWVYVVSGSLGPLGDVGAVNDAGSVLEPLWWGYLASTALCGVYAVVLRTHRGLGATPLTA